jgi:CRP-like cAMP-binding protein
LNIPESLVNAHIMLLNGAVGVEAASVLIRHMKQHNAKAGDTLVAFGDESDLLFLVCTGQLEAHLPLPDGERLVVGVVTPGQWLGEVHVIDQGPASATVVATQPTLLFSLSQGALAEVETARPEVAARLLHKLTKDLAGRLRNSTSGVVERVAGDEYRLASAPEKRTWLGRLFGGLMGVGA